MKDDLLDRLARENGTVMLSDLHGYISRRGFVTQWRKSLPKIMLWKNGRKQRDIFWGRSLRTSRLPRQPAVISVIV